MLSKTVLTVSKDIAREFLGVTEGTDRDVLHNKFGEALSTTLMYSSYFVPDSFDEIGRLKTIVNDATSSGDVFGLVISPTLECNASCHYCFESNVDKNSNLNDVGEILRLVNRNIQKYKWLTLQWFGGEPLLEKKYLLSVSEKIRQICDENDVCFSGSIVTNGYLMSLDTAKELLDVGIKGAQVTLEGDQFFHDKVRKLSTGGKTFSRIVNNIIDINGLIDVKVRIHVTPYNIDSVKRLIKYLGEIKIKNYVTEVYFSPVFNYKTCSGKEGFVHDDKACFTVEGYAQIEPILHKAAKENNLPLPDIFESDFSVCTAVNKNSIIVNQDSALYKCYFDLGDKGESVGSLQSGIEQSNVWNKWAEYPIPRDDECAECKLLPVCLGGCSKVWESSSSKNNSICSTMKFNLAEMMNVHYGKNV